jgi:Tfp pilus assembly protein PilO
MKFEPSKYSRDLKKYYQIPAVQSSLTVVLSLFVIAIFIAFALRPTLVSITNLKNTIEDANKTSKLLKVKVKNLQIAASQLETIKPLLPNLTTNIPTSSVMYGELVNTIEAISNNSGTVLDTQNLGASLLFSKIASPFDLDRNHEVITLKYGVSVTGSYPQLQQFLTTFLSMERLAMIDSVTISPIATSRSGNSKSSTSLKMDLSGGVFYIADQAQLTSILGDKKGGK